MSQNFTSANTSINSSKLPAVYNKINWECVKDWGHHIVADYGCGKFNNAKDFTKEKGFEWIGFDKFNRSEEENWNFVESLMKSDADIMICSNVLNVIDSEEEVEKIARILRKFSLYYFVTVYEGDKSGEGRKTKEDCYQRNEKIQNYLKYFPTAYIRNGVITNRPEFVK